MRMLVGALLAAVATTLLLFVMQLLIRGNHIQVDEDNARRIADIRLGETEIEARITERKPEKPDDPEEPPPEVEQPELQSDDVNLDAVNINPSMRADLNFSKGPGLSASDGEYLPMVKVQPQYPRRALSRGVEGYCIVEYTVTKTGAVRDPFVVDCSSTLFQKASLKAALKFKYKPRIEDGEPREVPGVQNKFTYRLAK